MTPDILRMVERLEIVFGAILAIYFGYKLFSIAHLKQESSGSFKSALFTFTASKVGPGVFFAAFGCYVLVASLNNPIKYDTSLPVNESAGIEQYTITSFDELKGAIEKLPDSKQKNILRELATKLSSNPHAHTSFYGNVNTSSCNTDDITCYEKHPM